MSNERERGGKPDLDLFEDLGRKDPEGALPPPPPNDGHVKPAERANFMREARKTLLGIPGPSVMDATAAAVARVHARRPGAPDAPAPPPPPPPPRRGSLPAIAIAPAVGALGIDELAKETERVPTEPPAPAYRSSPPLEERDSAPPPTVVNAVMKAAPVRELKLDMAWAGEEETTRNHEGRMPEPRVAAARMPEPPERDSDALVQTLQQGDRAEIGRFVPPPPSSSSIGVPAAATVPPPPRPSGGPESASLAVAFGALGQRRESTGALAVARPSQAMQAAPPPPPPTSQRKIAAPAPHAPPPPPPLSAAATLPIHVPPPQPPAPPPSVATPVAPAVRSPTREPARAAPVEPSGSHASGFPSAAPPPVAPERRAPLPARAKATTTRLPRSPSRLPRIAGLLVLVMAGAGAAGFFLMPRTTTLLVNVADSKGGTIGRVEVFVDGRRRCELSPCMVREVGPGVHELKVVAPGFEPLVTRATTDGRRDVQADLQLVAFKPAGSGIKIAGPSGLKLTVDGKEIGNLPNEVTGLEPGEHKLRFVGDRYAPLEKTVTLAKDELVDLGNVGAKVIKGKAVIQLGTPGARVYLVNGTNRKEVPQFPMAIEFEASDKWELQAVKDGFEDLHEPISFDDGQAEKTFTITLSPKGSAVAPASASASASASSTPPARPLAPAPAPLPRAPREPAAAKEPAPPKDPKPDDTKEASGETVLKINSLPASSITLDGKQIGVTPQPHVAVSPGSHTITFVNSEMSLKKTINVDIKAGETKSAFARLRE